MSKSDEAPRIRRQEEFVEDKNFNLSELAAVLSAEVENDEVDREDRVDSGYLADGDGEYDGPDIASLQEQEELKEVKFAYQINNDPSQRKSSMPTLKRTREEKEGGFIIGDELVNVVTIDGKPCVAVRAESVASLVGSNKKGSAGIGL